MRRLHEDAVMSKAKTISENLAEALPATADPRDELVALGMVATAIICQTEPEARAALVDTFCDTLRKGVASGLN
jgi:hypothetical protein